LSKTGPRFQSASVDKVRRGHTTFAFRLYLFDQKYVVSSACEGDHFSSSDNTVPGTFLEVVALEIFAFQSLLAALIVRERRRKRLETANAVVYFRR
jgi:hypothetical protein